MLPINQMTGKEKIINGKISTNSMMKNYSSEDLEEDRHLQYSCEVAVPVARSCAA